MVYNHLSFLCEGLMVLLYFAPLVRKTVSFILLFCLLVYIGGYHLIYCLYQQGLKTEMKAFLKENKSSQFGIKLEFAVVNNKIKDENFSWEDENEEFRYHEELYDVVKIEKREDKIVLVCLKDNDENQLENQIKEIHKINKTGSSKTSQFNLKFFSLFYLEKQSKIFVLGNEKKEIIPTYSSHLQTSFFDIKLPPPRC
jgi:hypothetical protein